MRIFNMLESCSPTYRHSNDIAEDLQTQLVLAGIEGMEFWRPAGMQWYCIVARLCVPQMPLIAVEIFRGSEIQIVITITVDYIGGRRFIRRFNAVDDAAQFIISQKGTR